MNFTRFTRRIHLLVIPKTLNIPWNSISKHSIHSTSVHFKRKLPPKPEQEESKQDKTKQDSDKVEKGEKGEKSTDKIEKEKQLESSKKKFNKSIPEKSIIKPQKQPQESNAENAVEKIVIPVEFPQLIAIPLTKRPLFPGFYRSIHVKDPVMIQAINNLIERRRPYIGVFLAKGDYSEDVVKDVENIHKIGVFAQITNTYQTGPDGSVLSIVVYPHRRIRISSDALVGPPSLFGKPLQEENKNWKG